MSRLCSCCWQFSARWWLSGEAVRLTLPAWSLLAQLWPDHPLPQQTHKLAAAKAGKMHLVVLPALLLLARLWPEHPVSQQRHKLAAALAGKMHLVDLPKQLLLAQLRPNQHVSQQTHNLAAALAGGVHLIVVACCQHLIHGQVLSKYKHAMYKALLALLITYCSCCLTCDFKYIIFS